MEDFNYVKGDIVSYIIKHKPTFAIHGANCCSIMGAGVARALAQEWPAVEKVDKIYMVEKQTALRRNPLKLGKYSYTVVRNTTMVFNLYTQLIPGNNEFNIYALEDAMTRLIKKFYLKDPFMHLHTLVMPKIGCGLAKDWTKTEEEAWNEVKAILIPLFKKYKIALESITVIDFKNV